MDIQARKVRELRSQHGWTQQHLAEACGVSLRTIQRIEKDGNAAPETLSVLCAVFEITREELFVVPRKNDQQMQRAVLGTQWLVYVGILILGMAIGAAVTFLANP